MIGIEGSRRWMVNFYQDQLEKFSKIGLGKLTEFNVKVTKELIAVTKRRLAELTTVYDSNLTPRALKLKKLKLAKLKKEGQLNGSTNGTRTAAAQSSENICTDGYEGSES